MIITGTSIQSIEIKLSFEKQKSDLLQCSESQRIQSLHCIQRVQSQEGAGANWKASHRLVSKIEFANRRQRQNRTFFLRRKHIPSEKLYTKASRMPRPRQDHVTTLPRLNAAQDLSRRNHKLAYSQKSSRQCDTQRGVPHITSRVYNYENKVS